MLNVDCTSRLMDGWMDGWIVSQQTIRWLWINKLVVDHSGDCDRWIDGWLVNRRASCIFPVCLWMMVNVYYSSHSR